MNIDIYADYKVMCRHYGGYIDQETSTPTDINFKNYYDTSTTIENGGKFIERIVKYLSEDYFNEISCRNNCIMIGFFNPTNGENKTIEMFLEECKNEHE